ncbi:MAG: rod shape-determining protein [Anaerolineaceae bacterium]|nr:rod shape-determining protein [Anaerolineaceae bacterium]
MATLSFIIRFDIRAIQVITQNERGDNLDAASYTPSGWEIIETVVEYLKTSHDLLISRVTAERVITKLASAKENAPDMKMEIRGRLVRLGIPGATEISNTELFELLSDHFSRALFRIIWGIKANLAFYSDHSDIEIGKQVTLTGDFCEIRHFDTLLEEGLQETCGSEFTVIVQEQKHL